ncbi:MAG TPA: methyl-accepting chemotaxis protein [Gemmatimonadaceae bacterium]|nr:methyl-accepting chemotaxis protein [Gemmatimonadaceae bacterium]
MKWTIGRRIAGALAIELTLLLIVAVIGAVALGRATTAYEQALAVRRTQVAPAIRAESELRGANVEQLRLFVADDQRYAKARDSLVDVSRKIIAGLRENADTGADSARWVNAEALLTRWNAAMVTSSGAQAAGNRMEALRIRAATVEPLRTELDSMIRGGVNRAQSYGDELAASGASAAQRAKEMILLGSLIALVVGLIAGYLISRSINRPLQETANVIASSSAEILAATTEQAAGTNESMAAVTETVATVDEVAQTATQSAQRARAVADAAQRAAEGGRAGRKAVGESVQAMQLVQTQVETMARGIVALAEQAQAIGEITTAVSDIAEQTKLLALNAAVESTRAGEHGRGFALVAAEIKALAGEAKESTTQVRKLLGEIQRATSAAVMATEQGTKQTAAAVRQVSQAGTIIDQLAGVVEESAQAAAQIVASAGQQALGMDQIRQAIANIHDATQQNLTATRQSEAAAQNLTSFGSRLVELVGARGRG